MLVVHKFEDGCYAVGPALHTMDSLPVGVFDVEDAKGTPYIRPKLRTADQYIETNQAQLNEVVNDIESFFDPETRKKYEAFGVTYKRGILLYGAPGTGKTQLINRIADMMTAKQYSVFYPDSSVALKVFQKTLPQLASKTPVIIVVEEVDGWVQYGDNQLIRLLDGEDSVANIYYIFTTNFIDKIPDRIKNRPSRVARTFWIQPPAGTYRQEFVKMYYSRAGIPINQEVLQAVIGASGLTPDQIKNIVISVECMGVSVHDAVRLYSQHVEIERQGKLTGLFSGMENTNDDESE